MTPYISIDYAGDGQYLVVLLDHQFKFLSEIERASCQEEAIGIINAYRELHPEVLPVIAGEGFACHYLATPVYDPETHA